MYPVSLEVRQGEPLMLRMIAFSSFIFQLDSTNTDLAEIKSQERLGKMIFVQVQQELWQKTKSISILTKFLQPPITNALVCL